MNQKIMTVFACLILVTTQTAGQNFQKEFNDLFLKKDTVSQLNLLKKWEKSDINDPELYTSYFNFYANKSKSEIITLGQDPKGDGVIQIMDQDKTKTKPVGYIYGDTQFNPEILSKGFYWINKGIEKFPNRLDMRFGKIYMFGQIEDYESFTQEIIKTIDFSAENKNKWTWTENKPLEDPKNYMLSSIQEYQVQLYNTENDSLLDNMKRIAESVLKYYPDHVESLSNLSIVFMIQKQFDNALEVLLKAEKLNPKDYIVLSNIAQAYKLKQDFKNSIKYYELTMKYGDNDFKKYAKEQIEELKRK